MTDANGLGISEGKITVSTSGLARRIRQFTHEQLKCNLALSLNATTDEIRTRLMPINAKYPIDEVLDATREWALATQRPATLEYVLIHGVNDSVADARTPPQADGAAAVQAEFDSLQRDRRCRFSTP